MELHSQRWLVETDIRSIKTTLNMIFISARSPDMIGKELILGICTYNLIWQLIIVCTDYAKRDARQNSAVPRDAHLG